MPPAAQSIFNALNSTFMAMLAKVCMVLCPIILAAALWAAQSWVEAKVEGSPIVVRMVGVELEHESRIRNLEEASRTQAVANTEILRRLDKLTQQGSESRDALNRIIGKLE